jgi:hypothetical protein
MQCFQSGPGISCEQVAGALQWFAHSGTGACAITEGKSWE